MHTKDFEPAPLELNETITDSDDTFDVVTPDDIQAGDLLELSGSNAKTTVLAICLGYINGFYHTYTQDGRWYVSRNLRPRFAVRHFVSQGELEPVLVKLPKTNLPFETMMNISQSNLAPDRVAGAQLLARMATFLRLTEQVMQRFGISLEKVHTLLTQAKAHRYLTIHDIYSVLFKEVAPNTPSVLYAIHRAVMDNHLCFREIGTLGTSTTPVFELTPASDVALVQNIQTLARASTNVRGKESKPLSSTPEGWTASKIGSFILKANEAIDQSRKFRDFTPHGMIGPAKQHRPPYYPPWNQDDLSILHFMRLWVCYDQFPPASNYNWIGSAILRATGKYADSEYLTTTVGWTFLQEVSYISPWDLHIRHLQRLPDVGVSRLGGFEPLQLGPTGIEGHISQDDFFAAQDRHDWKDLRAFAIDSADTTDIDDAVSIEPTDVPQVQWIHVHVADPASRIRPDSVLAKRAEKTPLNLYLSGHQSNMWGIGDELQKLFSLAPNRPSLTFSGMVNLKGELLDYKITPGILRSFIYMTQEEANKAVGDHDANNIKAGNFSVGTPRPEKPARRPMTTASELQPDDLNSLRLLDRVGKALEENRLAKGAMPVFPPKPDVKAYFDDDAIQAQAEGSPMEASLHCNGDPFIKIGWPSASSALVASTMRLAGEIAARWCSDRNIPIPYLSQPEAQKNLAALRSYTQNVYYPMVLRDEEVMPEHTIELFRLIGADRLSTRPGPYFLMGVDAYAKVTSPLRRYSDLLAHWQIENALLQERETGRVDVAKLPFQAETLETEVLPWMRLRQLTIRGLDRREGNRSYMLQALVRAWKYPDENSSPIPEKFRFTVRSEGNKINRVIQGTLDWFQMPANLSFYSLSRLGLAAANVTRGDVFEVRLVDVNAHLATVEVEAVRKIKVASD